MVLFNLINPAPAGPITTRPHTSPPLQTFHLSPELQLQEVNIMSSLSYDRDEVRKSLREKIHRAAARVGKDHQFVI
jgi:hypothetical protein